MNNFVSKVIKTFNTLLDFNFVAGIPKCFEKLMGSFIFVIDITILVTLRIRAYCI